MSRSRQMARIAGATRLVPLMPPAAYKTYAIRQPVDRQVKTACELAGCQAWRNGWETTVDERTELGMMQATYIRQGSGRTFREMRRGDGLTVFRFEPRQRCFAEHFTREQKFIERGGDMRGNPRGEVRVHKRPADWQESFGEHQDKLAGQAKQG